MSRPDTAGRLAPEAGEFAAWAGGYGAIHHDESTRARVRALVDRLAAETITGDGESPLRVLRAGDLIASAAMWLVVHETYALDVHLDGRALRTEEFKRAPEGHTGGALNMVPAYTGYMLANALTGVTRSWLMGQGHCVAAVDSVNLLLDNMTPAHAGRYDVSDAGLTRYVRDFYSYRLREDGSQDSPLGSHVNPHTAGGLAEGGYLGFAELQYVHMPLPGERLVVFLSDGAFEEQRGSDWAPRWWRAGDSGLVAPIMIANGRRIDQRSAMSQAGGPEWFARHLRLNGFDPIVFDGRDPAAFAWAILEMEARLEEAATEVAHGRRRYPVRLPYGVAVAPKGAGFHGEGTNAAHNLPLGASPRTDAEAARRFNDHARRLHVPAGELKEAAATLRHHARSGRPRERDHPLVRRDVRPRRLPRPAYRPVPAERAGGGCWTSASPMAAVDEGFMAAVRANPHLRPRVGNPDEIRSNRMLSTLETLRIRVTDPEPGAHEAIDGAVITVLNEEAVAGAAFGNKGGINIIVTYEAFAAKMQGMARQEITFAANCEEAGRPAGWLSVPLILTSHTWENAKNEQSHQDPSMAEAMLGEPSHVSRVIFPADCNTAAAAMREVYATRGQIWTMIVPKADTLPVLFTGEEAETLVRDGAMAVPWAGYRPGNPRIVLTAIGAYQLIETLAASARLAERRVEHAVAVMIEPGRFRRPRSRAEARHAASEETVGALYPPGVPRLFLTHTCPETILGMLHPLHEGLPAAALGYINRGGTVSTPGLLFLNRCSWAHAVEEAARLTGVRLEALLAREEIDALRGRTSPAATILERRARVR